MSSAVPASAQALSALPVPAVTPAPSPGRSPAALLADLIKADIPDPSTLAVSQGGALSIRDSIRASHIVAFGSEASTEVACEQVVPYWVGCHYTGDSVSGYAATPRNESYLRVNLVPSSDEAANVHPLAADALTLLTVPVNTVSNAAVVRVNAPGMVGDTIYQLLSPDGTSAGRRPGANAPLVTKILAYLKATSPLQFWAGVEFIDNHVATRSALARNYMGPFFPMQGDIGRPLPPNTVVTRVCTLAQFANAAAGAVPFDAAWGPRTWGLSVAVVPVLNEWLSSPDVMRFWIAAHLAYPLRTVRFFSDVGSLTGEVYANGVTTKDHLQHLLIPGPHSHVLLVLVNHQARTAPPAGISVSVGATPVALAANSPLAGGVDVDISPEIEVVTDDTVHTAHWTAALQWWYRVDGSKSAMDAALFTVGNYGSRVVYPEVRAGAAIAHPNLYTPSANHPAAVAAASGSVSTAAPFVTNSLHLHDDMLTTPMYQRVPSTVADGTYVVGTIPCPSALEYIRSAAGIVTPTVKVSPQLPTPLGLVSFVDRFGLRLAARMDAFTDSIRRPDCWLMDYRALIAADTRSPMELSARFLADLNSSLVPGVTVAMPGAAIPCVRALNITALTDACPAGRLSFLTRCTVLGRPEALPSNGMFTLGQTQTSVVDRLGQRWRIFPESEGKLSATFASAMRLNSPYAYCATNGAAVPIRQVAWGRQALIARDGVAAGLVPHKLCAGSWSAATRRMTILNGAPLEPAIQHLARLPVSSLRVNFSWTADLPYCWALWPAGSQLAAGSRSSIDYTLAYLGAETNMACPRSGTDSFRGTAASSLEQGDPDA